nr:replication protein [Morganella morganii]
MNYIVKDGNKIGVNKEVSAWKNQLRDTVSNLETKKVSKLETNDVSGLETHKRNTLKKKENIYTPISPKPEKPAKPEPFDANAHPLPDWLSRDTWVNWVTYRKDLKKPIKTKQTLNGLISRLTKFYEAGYTPESVIDESISNGWTGLFMPKSPPTRPRIVRPKRVQQFIPEDF